MGSGPQNGVFSAVFLPSTGQIRHFWPRDGLAWSLKTRGGCAPRWDVPGILVGPKKIGQEMREVFNGRIQVNNFQGFAAVESFVSDFQRWGWNRQELLRNFRDSIPILCLNVVMPGRFLMKFRRGFVAWNVRNVHGSVGEGAKLFVWRVRMTGNLFGNVTHWFFFLFKGDVMQVPG